MSLSITPDLKQKTALITGAGSGIGEQCAHALARAGAQVIVTDLTLARAQAVTAAIQQHNGKAIALALDVTDRDAISQLAQTITQDFSNIDILVNNAGILQRIDFTDDAVDDAWDKHMAVNLEGPFRLARAFLPSLANSKGTIVNIASINSFVSFAKTTPYVTSKGGIAQLTRTLATELGPQGIRVNAVAPGVIATPMTADVRADADRLSTNLCSEYP